MIHWLYRINAVAEYYYINPLSLVNEINTKTENDTWVLFNALCFSSVLGHLVKQTVDLPVDCYHKLWNLATEDSVKDVFVKKVNWKIKLIHLDTLESITLGIAGLVASKKTKDEIKKELENSKKPITNISYAMALLEMHYPKVDVDLSNWKTFLGVN